MRAAERFMGLAGLVLFLFGIASYALTGDFDLWTGVHIAGGGVLLAAGVFLNLAGVRRTVTARSTRERAQAATGAILFGAILVAANVLAARHPWRYDATEKKIHTLSERTLAVLHALDRPAELLAFFPTGDPARAEVGDLLGRYAAASDRIHWRFVDAEREPDLADQCGVRNQGVLVARVGKTIAQDSGAASEGITEQTATNLLIKVTRAGPHVVYMVVGHGEPAPEDSQEPGGLGALAASLRDESFEVKTLLLATAPEVPGAAAAVIVAGPRKPLLAHEVEALARFLSRGGRLLLLLDPGTDPGLGPLLADYRIAPGDNMIVDQEEIPFLGTRLGLDPIVQDFEPHAVTRGFKERIVLFEARSIDAATSGGLPGVEAQVLARTRPSSWAAADYRGILSTGQVVKGPKDVPGPIPVAVAASLHEEKAAAGDRANSRAGSTSSARIVVIGDSDLATNAHLADFFNREFVLNVVEWLAGSEDLVVEGPRGFRPSRLNMTSDDFRTLFRLGVLLMPEVLLIAGLAVWWRRRSL